MPPGLPGGSIARGSIFSVFGAGIGPAASPSLSFPLQTTLSGVSIRLTQGSTVVHAIPVFVGPGQINAIAPSNTPLSLVSLQLSFNNLKTATVPVVVVNSSFGIVTISGGKGPGILQNFVSASEQPVNSLLSTAQPDQAIILWGTGLGPVSFADNSPPTAGTLATQTEVFVGGIPAQVTYSGRTPCAGVDQIVFQVPANAPTGCWVPVLVRTGGVMVSNVVTMAISSDSSLCSEPMAGPLITGGRTARALAARLRCIRMSASQTPTTP